MKKSLAILAACLMALVLPALAPAQSAPNGPELDAEKEYYAVMDTSMGKIVFHLYADDAPLTVQNFVNLIEGTKPWKNPRTDETVTEPFYDGLTFHRVIPGFMIQGGCPIGNGTGSPGFRFQDEFQSGRRFDKPYILAMANSGPGTNGSQFFVTDQGSTPSHLNNRHTIFGEAIEGRDVVDAIARVRTDSPRTNKPVTPVVIEKATVVRLPKGAKWGSSAAPASEPAMDEAPASQPATDAEPPSKPVE